MSLVWAVSFAICYLVSHRILSKDRFIWDWWDFAFLPFPPRSFADLKRDFWQVLNVFNSPAWVLTPLGVLASAFLAMGLFLLGGLSLGRRWRGGLYLLLAPLLFTLVASALHQYPFHGRLLLFLGPHGPSAGRRRGGRPDVVAAARDSTFVLGAFLLFQPASDVLWHQLIMARIHDAYDSHGDLSPDLLDYLEKLE